MKETHNAKFEIRIGYSLYERTPRLRFIVTGVFFMPERGEEDAFLYEKVFSLFWGIYCLGEVEE